MTLSYTNIVRETETELETETEAETESETETDPLTLTNREEGRVGGGAHVSYLSLSLPLSLLVA